MSISFALILCGAVSAEDVGNNSTGLADTAWPSFQGDSNHTGQSDYNGPQTNTTEWILPGSSNQNSNLAIGKDGTIYCGFRGSNYLYALYSNGTEKWKYPTNNPIMSVTIGKEGTIYASDDGKSTGTIYAFKDNGNNATKIWSYNAKYPKMISIGPDRTLYFGSGTSSSSQFNALKDNGDGTCTPKWTFPLSSMLYSPPTIGPDGTIYFGNSRYLYALRDNGNNCTVKWKFEHGNLIRCNPSIGPDGTLYFGVQGESGGEPYTLYALRDNGDSFKLKWYDNIGNILTYSLAIANDGTIYVGTAGIVGKSYSSIMAFKDNEKENIKLWNYTFTGNCELLSSPVIGADGTIYIGSGNGGDIYAFYPADGKVKWKYLLGDPQIYNLAINSNGALYVHTRDFLIAFKDPAPVANFTTDITNGSSPLTVQFTDKSNYPTSWLWDFGDGTTSNKQNPSHTYTKAGIYTVKLTVANNNGNDSDILTKTDYITVLQSNVYVNVTSSKTNPQVGDKVTYTFKLGNSGPGIAKDVVFTYVIPEGVEFAGANVDQGTWTYDKSTRTLTWNMSEVAVGDPYLWLDLRVLSAGSFNINPTVSVSGSPLEENIGSLLVNAASVPTSAVTVNAATKTIPMQDTGVPLTGLTMALLLVGSGLALARRK